jgi:adenylate cyclase
MNLTPDALIITATLGDTPGLLRHHKVVLVVDLVGSVSLMQQDEAGVIARWRAFVAHVTQTILSDTEGHMVKSLGDGLMLEFDSAPKAVAAALAMHEWLEAQQSDANMRMQLRAGLHSAQVYEDEHDIYGTGVNLAARIATLAAPGETVISSAVRDSLTDGLDGMLEDLGECYLKHVAEPVHVYRVGRPGHEAVIRLPRIDAVPMRPAIAVIPFECRNAEIGQFALGELMADGVIGQLSRTRELKVISRLSTSVFRGRLADVSDAQTHLGADYVLSGSYAVSSGKMLVSAELVDTRKNAIVWTERTTGDVADLFEAHSELCDSIASGCHRALLEKEAQAALTRPLPTLQSYSLLLGSIGLMHRSAQTQFLKTREVLDALIERHSLSALPRVWLAKWYVLCTTRGLVSDPQSQAQAALNETRRALDAEPGNALAWAMQGFVYCHLVKDIDSALRSCNQALEWNANESLAWLFKAMVHAFDGDGEAAFPAGQKALELSPLDPLKYYYDSLMASIAISAGQYALAASYAERSLRVNAAHLSSYRALILAQALSGQIDAARKNLALLMQQDPQFSIARFERGYPSRERVPAYLERLKDALRAAGAKEN